MSATFVMLMLAAQASQPSSRPALRAGGTGSDVSAKVVIMVDVDEAALNMSESWTLENNSGKVVGAEHIDFPIGAARLLRVDEDATGFKAKDDSSGVYATQGLGAGSKIASFAYLKDVSGTTAVLTKRIPVNLESGMLILPSLDDLQVTSNQPIQSRISSMNGRTFSVHDFSQLPAGTVLELTISGLPSHSTVPRLVAGASAIGVLLWMIIALGQGRQRRRESVIGAMSAEARRDRIVRAIELLQRDFDNETIKEKRYQRRHAELMAELAAVLREIDIVRAGAAAS